MLKATRSYEEACRTFRWRIPDRYNVAFDVCDRQTMAGADGHRTALIVEGADGQAERYTFHVLRLLSNRLANVLVARGVRAGDRVVVGFGASVEAAVAVLAVTKMGAVVVPVPPGLGEQPVAWRLADSGAVAALVDGRLAARVMAAAAAMEFKPVVIAAGEAPDGAEDLWAVLERAGDSFAPAVSSADDPAFLFYPCDGVGKPAGTLHAHRALPGNLPPVEFALGFFPQFGDVLWSPGEWMSFEGLLWGLLPAWHHGVPVVAGAADGSAEPDQGLGLMARHGVRAALLDSGHARRLAEAAQHHPHPMPRAIATRGEPLTVETHQAIEAAFGVAANELWGVCETGAVAANNAQVMELRHGSPGRASPGVTVEAIDGTGRIMRAGEVGMLAVSPGAPGGLLGTGGEGGPSRQKLPTGWIMTGRLGSRDLDGYLWLEPQPAEDGVVTVSGLRVALDDVQAALALHPRVGGAGVVPFNDGLKAFVVPAAGQAGDTQLAGELQEWLARRRGAHEVPRRIEFVDALPTAPDGSVLRDDLASRPLTLDAPSAEDRWVPLRR
ncbi:MAG: AMP-binding protein [Solirubrobacterales bacterium]